MASKTQSLWPGSWPVQLRSSQRTSTTLPLANGIAQAAAVTERTSPSNLSGGTSSTTRSIIFTTSPAPGEALAPPRCILAAATECHGSRPVPVRMLRRGSAEGEAVGLGAWIEEGDLAGAVIDGAGLADEL